MNDASSLNRVLRTVKPDEIYNLGAQSHVRVSFDVPEYTAEVTGVGTVRYYGDPQIVDRKVVGVGNVKRMQGSPES